jgi:hypothetical protein
MGAFIIRKDSKDRHHEASLSRKADRDRCPNLLWGGTVSNRLAVVALQNPAR